MTPPSSSFRLHRSCMREASEITSRDASEQILALIRVGYTVLTYPRVFPTRFHLPTILPYPRLPLLLCCRAAPRAVAISAPELHPSRGYLHRSCLLLYFCFCGIFDVSVGPGRLLREATRFIAPTFRSLVNHALSKILRDICKK